MTQATRVKIAIFDIDGTLTNTNSVDDECFIKALSDAHAITEVNTDWAAYPHTTDSGIIAQIWQERFGREPKEAELGKLKSCFLELLKERYQSNPLNFLETRGASAALSRLKREADWAVAIATGSWRESALLKLRAANLDFDGIPCAYAEDGLSREEILLSAVSLSLQQHRVSGFAKTVSIGDGLWDFRTARRLEFAFLGVGRGGRAAILEKAGAKHVVEDFADYGQLVKFLNDAEVPDEQVSDEH